MSIESLVLLGALCVASAVNVTSVLVLRSLAQRLITGVLAYRPGPAVDAPSEPLPQDQGRSPLQDVFQQYSKLTARMSDIIFQLTESRQGARDKVLAAARSIQVEAAQATAQRGGPVVAGQAGQAPAPALPDRSLDPSSDRTPGRTPDALGLPAGVRPSEPAQPRERARAGSHASSGETS